MDKVVLDTNMFLSAFLFRGATKIIFNAIFENKLRLYVSSELKKEVLNKIEQYGATEQGKIEIAYFLHEKSITIQPKIKLSICRDQKDNFLLELAQTVNADFLITRDKDLLEIPNTSWNKSKIISPEEFLSILHAKKLIA